MKWLHICILILGCISLSKQVPKTVTLEDVRDALVHLVQMVRQTEDKLERHEFRERQLGEQVKKSLVILDKRLKTMEPLRGTVMRLDERIAAIETILIKKNEKEDEQLQKTSDTVEDIKKNLPIIIDKLKNDIMNKILEVQKNTPTQVISPKKDDTISKADLRNFQNDVKQELNDVKKSMKFIENELAKIKNDNSKINEMNEKSTDSLEKVKRQLSDSEHLLEKYENKLAEMNNKIPAVPIPNYKEQNEMHSNVLQALDTQKSKVDQIISNIKDVAAKVDNLPQNNALDVVNNNTMKAIQELRQENYQQSDRTTGLINNRLKDLENAYNNNHNQIMKAIDDLYGLSSIVKKRIDKDFENITKEIKDLGRFEIVLLQAANSVLDTKRSVEFGVHQILSEVEDLLKTHMKELNTSISDRFDNFELAILDEETGALQNLTSKIAEEIGNVWRQIGIMHQQMSLNADTLNKLQSQTDVYVNGSLNVMDSMKGKVGQITGKMSEVDENLNYLLGRLSLVTQEFNMIKTGLGSALEQIKSSFIEVQNKIKDHGPGPHNITSNEVLID